ncbi:MAG: hypothetical protein KDA61_05195, partial [Planctomycetales bacterium]|nr:hypothetical protein [Planctomycetales bacterium]
FRFYEDTLGGGGLVGDLGTHGDQMNMLGHSFLPCLAASCDVGATLNLVFLQYEAIGDAAVLSFVPDDVGTRVYNQYRDYAFDDSWFLAQIYDVSPEPGAWVLIGAAAFCRLACRTGRRKAACRRGLM